MLLSERRMELSICGSPGCFSSGGTVNTRSLAGLPAIVLFTNFALIAVPIGSRHPI